MILKQTHIVQERTDPIRLQEYGVGIFQQISTKSALKKALKKNQITVDGVVGSTATFIKGGEIIIYHATEKETNTRLVLIPTMTNRRNRNDQHRNRIAIALLYSSVLE